MNARRTLGLLTLLPLILVACADNGSSPGGGSSSAGGSTNAGDLQGTVWTLDQASMAALASDVPSGATVTLAFSDHDAHGTSACNSYSGGYQASDDGSLSFDQLASTMMACDAPLMTLETAYLKALEGLTTFSIDGDLVLTGDGVPLTFVAQPEPTALPLTGTTWTLTSIAAGDAVSSALAGTPVTAVFDADGLTIAGTAGCNRYSGTYTQGETGLLTFSPLATTKMMCAEDVMVQESAFLMAMEKVEAFQIDGKQLQLLDGAGAMLLGFDGAA